MYPVVQVLVPILFVLGAGGIVTVLAGALTPRPQDGRTRAANEEGLSGQGSKRRTRSDERANEADHGGGE